MPKQSKNQFCERVNLNLGTKQKDGDREDILHVCLTDEDKCVIRNPHFAQMTNDD